ncbi:4-hydroxybenzoate polyprenyltransferase [Pseudoduganella flava]|nr:UbiA family prenyltransferase [Pseudoduganella flava]TWI46680.1 4-hydroxybenzoate polyprenyltransferase [Pseudoduganella flava]
MMPALAPVLALCRVSNLPTVWMNVLTAALLCGWPLATPQGAAPVLLLMVSLSCFYCGGMALNDLCDRTHDALHQPFRPIPAGRIGIRQAWGTTFLLFGLALAALLAMPSAAGLGAGIALLAVICAYDYLHKAHAASVLLMACARLLVYVVTAAALTGTVAEPVWLAASVQAAYVLALTAVARGEHRMPGGRYRWPVVPWLIALMPLVDGALAAWWAGLPWLAAGVLGTVLTRLGQRRVRGD